ncbi:MAG: transporter substrate-binding domain-containing protein [Kordiimonadaceae bacterium]|jgi:polar amino acid transport system substrate-binding protein|nr:transporter substrate-binding domain-containing protein [Kordiimonadaceae bacterium]
MKLVVQKLILSFVFFYFAAAISYSADLADIKKRGYINIGVALGGEPIGFWDEKNNPIGYDIDFAEKLAKALGVNVSLINVHGDARISMLVSGQLDVVVGNLTVTDARAKIVDFSNAYFRTGLKIAVQKGSGIKTISDLSGKSVVVGRGTSGAVFLQQKVPDAKLVFTDKFAPDGLLLMRQKRVDAGIEDGSFIEYMIGKMDNMELLPESYESGDIAVGIKKGQPDLLNWVNQFVAQYISSGDFDRSYKKWWGADSIPPDLTIPNS